MVRVKTFILLAIGCLVVASGFIVFTIAQKRQSFAYNTIFLSSPQFSNNGVVPVANTCDGADLSPEFNISNIPEGTESIVMDLTETAGIGTQGDWVLWNLSPDITKIPSNPDAGVGVTGVNAAGKNAYNGPCPASGTRHYRYEAYALNTILDLPRSANYGQMQQAMQTHIIGYGSLTESYSRSAAVVNAVNAQ